MVSGRCVEAIWELSGVCLKFSRGCLCPEGFSKLSGVCLEGVYKVFGRIFEDV